MLYASRLGLGITITHSCDECSFNKNPGSPIKKLVLVISIIFTYLYTFYYHPVNLKYSNMAENLLNTQTDSKYELLNIEEHICHYTLHKDLLVNYKGNITFPKGFKLVFNVSFCTDDK